jgi:SAM-dependent methyltransferase
MSTEETIDLPTNTCAYERYNPQTLEPLNQETFVRLQELGWSAQDFADRSVLDIGCNSGLLTMYALRLGAAKVHACDVQPALVEFVSAVVRARGLPVTVSQKAFDKLQPAEDRAEIVLFMEVLHWVVSQGLPLRDVIRRLSELTGHILYLEFPWSVKEPSIQKQTKLTEETYSSDTALDELTRYFKQVRVVRFMHYFGFTSGSQRVLIEARVKRPEATVLAQLPNVYSLDVSLSRGRNESYLLSSAQGPLVAKLLALESPFTQLPLALCNRMFDAIVANRPVAIVAPQKHGGRYLLPAPGNRHWMIFPFIGQLPFNRDRRPLRFDFDRLIALFLQVRRDFRHFSPDLLKALRGQGLVRNVRSLTAPSAAWLKESGELAEIVNRVLPIMEILGAADHESLDALCHGDLQTGNFVLDEKDVFRVVDLDTLSVGTIYSDGLTGLIWRGAEADVLANFCARLNAEENRAVSRHDVSYAIANGISWFNAVRAWNAEKVVQEQIARLRQGLLEALKLHSRVG